MALRSRHLFSSLFSRSCLITAGLVSAAVHLPLPASAVTVWNWSFQTTSPNQSASGTFTTADVTPTAFTTYSITSIDGTYINNGSSYAILGLSDFYYSDNLFQWNGTSLSTILTTNNGIAFRTVDDKVNFYSRGPGMSVQYTYNENTSGYNITSSTLSPQSSPPSVPGPLPLFGAAAAFSSSRHIRRRLANRG